MLQPESFIPYAETADTATTKDAQRELWERRIRTMKKYIPRIVAACAMAVPTIFCTTETPYPQETAPRTKLPTVSPEEWRFHDFTNIDCDSSQFLYVGTEIDISFLNGNIIHFEQEDFEGTKKITIESEKTAFDNMTFDHEEGIIFERGGGETFETNIVGNCNGLIVQLIHKDFDN